MTLNFNGLKPGTSRLPLFSCDVPRNPLQIQDKNRVKHQDQDNVAALRILENETQQPQQAVASSQESLQLFTNRYKGGVDTYLQAITAQTIALANERNAMDILRRRLAHDIAQDLAAFSGTARAGNLPGLHWMAEIRREFLVRGNPADAIEEQPPAPAPPRQIRITSDKFRSAAADASVNHRTIAMLIPPPTLSTKYRATADIPRKYSWARRRSGVAAGGPAFVGQGLKNFFTG
jgi:hypothetical protein